MEAVVFVAVALALGALGIRIGMLAAPRIDRWIQRSEDAANEEERRRDSD